MASSLGGAALQIPVLIDGFISGVAALVAARICPEAADYMIASHVSKEPAAHLVLDELGKEAVLHADMCLGEGTGAIALCLESFSCTHFPMTCHTLMTFLVIWMHGCNIDSFCRSKRYYFIFWNVCPILPLIKK